MTLKVRDIMHARVETVDQDERPRPPTTVMRVKRIHHLIVTAGPEIVGVLSERDLGGKDREAMRQTHKVRTS